MRFVPSSPAAGVTLITHGLNSSVDDWVIAMADQIGNYPRFPGTRVTCYEIYFVATNSAYVPAWRRLSGDPPTTTDSGEILIKLDWRQLANNSYSTYDVAAAVAPRLLDTVFVPELNGHALVELPLHLIGHSRGGSLVCQLSRLLGTNGVWVDHLTTLDPHPLNNDGFSDFPYTVKDAPAHTYENVLFHDNYFQTINILFYGEAVAGAYVRELTDLDGGYSDLAAAHSNVHLWYHGTVELGTPADDTVATIGGSQRRNWWTGAEASGAAAGFYYSLIGGGDRLSASRPAGAGTAQVLAGYNQRWDLGVGLGNNRTALPVNRGAWPNLIRLDLAGTNLVAFGQTKAVTFAYQWAQPIASNAMISVYLDDDFNPFDGNEHLVGELAVVGSTAADVGFGRANLTVTATNATPGVHPIFARIQAAGRTRYLYAPQLLTVFSSFEPPSLGIARDNPGRVRVDVHGRAGQRVVLQDTDDFANWQPLGTNWLGADPWGVLVPVEPETGRGFRAVLQ